MKAVFSALALSLLAFAAQAQTRPALTDTIVVRLPNQAVMTLQVRDAQQLRQLPQYHLDSLVARLGTYIQRADAAAKTAPTDKVTLEFFPNQDQPGQGLPEEIKVTTYKNKPGQRPYGPSNKVEVLLEKKFGVVVNTDRKTNDTPRAPATRPDRQANRDSVREKRFAEKASGTDLVFDFGLNALVNRGGPAAAPRNNDIDLRPWGSRYVNIGMTYHQRLGGKHSPLNLLVGPEFAFNNYMLEGNNKWVNQNGYTYVTPETNGRQYQKTKLATSAINLPLMLQLNFRDQHFQRTFTLGAGGFVGYRLGSWTKLKYFENGNTYKDKDHGSYNLQDWQYGLQGTIGYGELTLFAKYNLNKLFHDGQGPQAQTLAFGVRITGF
ncbi:PorT family protein [Hymenobacter sp. RP-2-7]|uniref:PorT family protein n=1 Tax=Hymenobacter polaris TaxID=2682546 RepID=A0A7Y0ACI7_9BACT|nr:outer membrane beta-barrel protein [Hymenobacter polaris]NML64841.1 PorT family protein [Hymenobacter polaris]